MSKIVAYHFLVSSQRLDFHSILQWLIPIWCSCSTDLLLSQYEGYLLCYNYNYNLHEFLSVIPQKFKHLIHFTPVFLDFSVSFLHSQNSGIFTFVNICKRICQLNSVHLTDTELQTCHLAIVNVLLSLFWVRGPLNSPVF